MIDPANKITLWWGSIILEMTNIGLAYGKYEGDVRDLAGYQEVQLHMIFDMKLGEKLRGKIRLLEGIYIYIYIYKLQEILSLRQA